MSSIVERVRSWTSKLATARAAGGEVHAAEHELRHCLEVLDDDEARLRTMPSPPELLQREIATLAPLGQRLPPGPAGAAVLAAFSTGISEDGSLIPANGFAALDPVVLSQMGLDSYTLQVHRMFAPDRVAAVFTAWALAALRDQEPVLSIPERQERLRAIQKEKPALRRQHAELVDELRRHGFNNFEHLPEERARRRNIIEAHKRWQQDMALNRDAYERKTATPPPEPERPGPDW